MKNNTLRELRGKKTIQEVAHEIGIPISTYACIENGIRTGRTATLFKIAKHFNVPMESIICFETGGQ